ncbi:hypothetical protein IFM89_028120 [Coptis chinensis]|uniref:Transmembrane protein n=1 Tax=Coptis chinensis TaxID=261450 RepID=A0A835LXG0_9MAGN|nr:hypothetical protein IFM89_028120 [Coptis chinensis]
MASSSTSLNFTIPNFTISQKQYKTRSSLSLTTSFFTSPKSLTLYKKSSSLSTQKRLKLQRHSRNAPVVVSAQFDILRVVQTAWKVGKDGIEAGTDLVPASIPRPLARIGVGGLLLSISLFVLKSFLSTAFFVLGVMGLVYFVFIALNKDDGPRGGGGGNVTTDDSLEEARRIMEKYK